MGEINRGEPEFPADLLEIKDQANRLMVEGGQNLYRLKVDMAEEFEAKHSNAREYACSIILWVARRHRALR